jgi:hypothetical protein
MVRPSAFRVISFGNEIGKLQRSDTGRFGITSGEMCGLTVTPPPPLFFVSVDGGVEIICFDRLLQVLILRELLVDDNLQR